MAYLFGYLFTIVAISLLVGAVFFHNQDESSGFTLIAAAILLWPLTLFCLPPALIINWRKEEIRTLAMRVFHSLPDKSDDYNTVTTFNLKLLIKAARKGWIELKVNQIEALKKELVSRIAEDNLLK